MRVKRRAGLGDLHFHDLRGTPATKLYLANLSNRETAEILVAVVSGCAALAIDGLPVVYADDIAGEARDQ